MREVLDFCAEKGITSDTEMISMQDIKKPHGRMLKSDMKDRFVIDMQTRKDAA